MGRGILLVVRFCFLLTLFLWGYWWGMGGIELDDPVIDKNKRVKVGGSESEAAAATQPVQAQGKSGKNHNQTGGRPGKKSGNEKARSTGARRRR